MVKPFIGEVGFGFLDFLGFDEGRIRDSTSQVVADDQKLESVCSDLSVARPLFDDTDITGLFMFSFLGVHISLQPKNEMRLDQVEVILGTVDPKHRDLPTIMIEGAQKTNQFVTGISPVRDQAFFSQV